MNNLHRYAFLAISYVVEGVVALALTVFIGTAHVFLAPFILLNWILEKLIQVEKRLDAR